MSMCKSHLYSYFIFYGHLFLSFLIELSRHKEVKGAGLLMPSGTAKAFREVALRLQNGPKDVVQRHNASIAMAQRRLLAS